MFLFLNELFQVPLAREAAVHIALVVCRDFFRRLELRIHKRNKRGDLAVFGAADPDALFEAGISFLVRCRVGYIHGVVIIDEDAARPSELFPFGEEFSIGVENLNAVVRAIADEDASRGIQSDRVRVRRTHPAPNRACPRP